MRTVLLIFAITAAAVVALFRFSGLDSIFYSPHASDLDPTSPVVHLTRTDFPKVDRRGKGDPLLMIAFKDSGNGTADIEGPMSIRLAAAFKGRGYEVYVEGTDEYDDTITAYWPENRTWPVAGHEPHSLPGDGMAFKIKPLAER